jgi:hypothetical protein
MRKETVLPRASILIKRLDKSKDTVSRLLVVWSELVVLVPCIAVDGLSSAELRWLMERMV